MAFPVPFLDEVRARCPVSVVVAPHVRLVRRGRRHIGLCPFHQEKTPSFTVSDDKGFFHCFGCEAHGDAFDFVMRVSGLDFPAAVEHLARQAGLEPPPHRGPHAGEGTADPHDRLRAVVEAAVEWFTAQLDTVAGAEARRVLEERGLAGEAAAAFRLGLAPTRRAALQDAMGSQGFAEDELIAAGLATRPEDGGACYDTFRNRLMFPIADRRGRVVGFGGRALGAAAAKYINSPETSLFHKGRTLYNLHGARAAARDSGTVIVAEGYTDVIALWRAGVRHAVAPLGTALTETQMRELWRLAPEPVLCLDGDAAGGRAALRAARNALPLLTAGHSLRFALLSEGDDPDSLLQAGRIDALESAIEGALPLSTVLWRSATTGDFSTPERRAALRRELFGMADEIRDETVREYYRGHFGALLERSFGGARVGRGAGRRHSGARSARLAGPLRPERRLAPTEGLGRGVEGSARRRERVLVATLLNHPEVVPNVLETAASVELESADMNRLFGRILEVAGQEDSLDRKTLLRHFTDSGEKALVERLIGSGPGPAERFVRKDASSDAAEAGWRDTLALHRRASLEAERQAAARKLVEAENESALAHLRALQSEADAEDWGLPRRAGR